MTWRKPHLAWNRFCKRTYMQMFFMAIVLPERLNEKILLYKKWMQEHYGCRVGLKSPAHITLIPPFWTDHEKEASLKTDLENISAEVKPFFIFTNHFSAFRPKTIFVAVEENEELNALKKTTDQYFGSQTDKIKLDQRPFHPHITIATRDLHKKDFAEAWPHFEKRSFREDFEVTGLSLLKHNGQSWDVVYTSAFAG